MGIRKGMWVVYADRVGIAASIKKAGTVAEFHRVDEKGLTSMVIPEVPVDELRQARLSEIPEPRRPSRTNPRLGYED